MRVAIIAQATTEKSLYTLLSALCALNIQYLRTHANAPRLYDTRVAYRRETEDTRRTHHDPADADEWWTIPEVLREGIGDCEDLACYRVAELRVRDGIQARPHLREVRPGHWHVVVELPDGTIEDPSAVVNRREREAVAL